MKNKPISTVAFLLFALLVGAAALAGVHTVPFHPDESTFLYLSGDFNLLWQNPLSMAWQPSSNDARQLYRTLDAPMGRYLVGFGRWAAGLPPLTVDWDWSQTWEENNLAGALPPANLLTAGRVVMTALLPFSLLFLFLSARKVANERTAWIAAFLLASNALVLLHGRRAVSEGAVIFTASLAMWSILAAPEKPWLIAVSTGLAFCAKYSLGAVAPVGLLATLWQPGKPKKVLIRQACLFIAVFLGIVIVLNPFLWAHPLQAVQAAVANRADLAARQVADRPEQALNSPGLRLLSLVGSLYLTPPIFAETGNYALETGASESSYLANPLNNLFRSLSAGAFLLLLGMFGFYCAARCAVKDPSRSRQVWLLLALTISQGLALLALVPLPFQRYYLPLVPLTCLWSAWGLERILTEVLQPVQRIRAPKEAAFWKSLPIKQPP